MALTTLMQQTISISRLVQTRLAQLMVQAQQRMNGQIAHGHMQMQAQASTQPLAYAATQRNRLVQVAQLLVQLRQFVSSVAQLTAQLLLTHTQAQLLSSTVTSTLTFANSAMTAHTTVQALKKMQQKLASAVQLHVKILQSAISVKIHMVNLQLTHSTAQLLSSMVTYTHIVAQFVTMALSTVQVMK